MRVYLLYESSGYDDTYSNHIHSIYLNLGKAQFVKSELESYSAQIDKCQNCVCSGYCIEDCEYEDCENCDEMRIKYAKEHCMIADPYIDKWIQDGEEHTRLKCHNKIIGYGTDYSYRIEEKEVVK